MAIHTLDKAIEIIFNDREYYLSLSKSERGTMRKDKMRFKENKLKLNAKINLVKKYGGEIIDINVKL